MHLFANNILLIIGICTLNTLLLKKHSGPFILRGGGLFTGTPALNPRN